MKGDENGWHGVPGGTNWRCPECGSSSPIDSWREVELGCDECGAHDGRECPVCAKCFDHVWSVKRLAEAQPRVADRPKNPRALDVPVNLAMLTTNTWTTINWDQAEIRQRNAPAFSLKGQQLKLLTQESYRVVSPSQLWVWLADEQDNRWHVDIQCRNGDVRARVIQEPTGYCYSYPPTR